METYILYHAMNGDTIEVDIDSGDIDSNNKGMAIQVALDQGRCLSGYDLCDSDLRGVDLSYMDFRAARFANCDLRDVNFTSSDLSFSDFTDSDLTGAVLIDSNSRYCCFDGADLSEANLSWSSITGTSYADANLSGAVLESVFGVNEYIKCTQIDIYAVTYTNNFLQVQCQGHPISVWKAMTPREQIACGYKIGYRWAKENMAWLFETMERYPAK